MGYKGFKKIGHVCSTCVYKEIYIASNPCNYCVQGVLRGSNWTAIENTGGDIMEVEVESIPISHMHCESCVFHSFCGCDYPCNKCIPSDMCGTMYVKNEE